VPIDASGLYKIAHSVDGNGSGKGNPATAKFKSGHKKWNLFTLVPIVSLYGPRRNPHMTKIAFAVAIAAAVLMPAPLLVGAIPAEAQNLKMAQVDVQIGRDRDRRRGDQGTTVGVGPGGVTVGPKQNCRMVTTTVEQGGRTVTRKERRCD
jgi:hypothetical protein